MRQLGFLVLLFLYKDLKIWCLFYIYGTCRWGQTTLQELQSFTCGQWLPYLLYQCRFKPFLLFGIFFEIFTKENVQPERKSLWSAGLRPLYPMALESKTRSSGVDLVSKTDTQSQQLFWSSQSDTSLRPREWDCDGQAWKPGGGKVSCKRPGTRWPALWVLLVLESPDAVGPAGGPSRWCVISQG